MAELPNGFMRITTENKKTTAWTAHLSYKYMDVPESEIRGATKAEANRAFDKWAKSFDFDAYLTIKKAEADEVSTPDLPNKSILQHQLEYPHTIEEHNGIKFIFIEGVWSAATGFVRVHDSVSYPTDIDFKNKVAYVGIAKNHNINQNLFHHHKDNVVDYIVSRWDRMEARDYMRLSYIEDMHKYKNTTCLVSPLLMAITMD